VLLGGPFFVPGTSAPDEEMTPEAVPVAAPERRSPLLGVLLATLADDLHRDVEEDVLRLDRLHESLR
jgi:hypothetical protein